MSEEAECKLGSVNFKTELDPGEVFRLPFGVTGISDNWSMSTMGAVVKGLGALATVTQPMQESQTISERRLGFHG